MHRNDHPTAIKGLHQKGNPATNAPATVVTDALMNALQEEIAHVIEGMGFELDKANNTQLLAAIRQIIGGTLVDGKYVTHPELGDAAYKKTGAGANQVAAGDHPHHNLASVQELNNHIYAADPHTQYELKARLGPAAYRSIGAGAGQVAEGNHTHAEFGTSARAYYADVYAYGATASAQALSLAASPLPISNGDTLFVRWQQYYIYGTGNGTAAAYRSVYTYWLYQAGWYLLMERI
ncbi:hypothetical protein ACI77I_26085 [Pseudomonas sp. D47]|uniref:hypothetical protein n=1 Tax=Pseudomonas sp. D47 TaxID=3159447 RepID=UPI00387A8D69